MQLALEQTVKEITGDPAIPRKQAPRQRTAHKLVGWFFTVLSCLPLGAAERPVLHLRLRRAVELAALPEACSPTTGDESVQQAEARSAQARAAFLPDLDASVSQLNQTRNLAALGIGLIVQLPVFSSRRLSVRSTHSTSG